MDSESRAAALPVGAAKAICKGAPFACSASRARIAVTVLTRARSAGDQAQMLQYRHHGGDPLPADVAGTGKQAPEPCP